MKYLASLVKETKKKTGEKSISQSTSKRRGGWARERDRNEWSEQAGYAFKKKLTGTTPDRLYTTHGGGDDVTTLRLIFSIPSRVFAHFSSRRVFLSLPPDEPFKHFFLLNRQNIDLRRHIFFISNITIFFTKPEFEAIEKHSLLVRYF